LSKQYHIRWRKCQKYFYVTHWQKNYWHWRLLYLYTFSLYENASLIIFSAETEYISTRYWYRNINFLRDRIRRNDLCLLLLFTFICFLHFFFLEFNLFICMQWKSLSRDQNKKSILCTSIIVYFTTLSPCQSCVNFSLSVLLMYNWLTYRRCLLYRYRNRLEINLLTKSGPQEGIYNRKKKYV
jgi:hypothetical protein